MAHEEHHDGNISEQNGDDTKAHGEQKVDWADDADAPRDEDKQIEDWLKDDDARLEQAMKQAELEAERELELEREAEARRKATEELVAKRKEEYIRRKREEAAIAQRSTLASPSKASPTIGARNDRVDTTTRADSRNNNSGGTSTTTTSSVAQRAKSGPVDLNKYKAAFDNIVATSGTREQPYPIEAMITLIEHATYIKGKTGKENSVVYNVKINNPLGGEPTFPPLLYVDANLDVPTSLSQRKGNEPIKAFYALRASIAGCSPAFADDLKVVYKNSLVRESLIRADHEDKYARPPVYCGSTNPIVSAEIRVFRATATNPKPVQVYYGTKDETGQETLERIDDLNDPRYTEYQGPARVVVSMSTMMCASGYYKLLLSAREIILRPDNSLSKVGGLNVVRKAPEVRRTIYDRELDELIRGYMESGMNASAIVKAIRVGMESMFSNANRNTPSFGNDNMFSPQQRGFNQPQMAQPYMQTQNQNYQMPHQQQQNYQMPHQQQVPQPRTNTYQMPQQPGYNQAPQQPMFNQGAQFAPDPTSGFASFSAQDVQSMMGMGGNYPSVAPPGTSNRQ